MSQRWMILGIFLLGVFGTGAELVFIEHTGGWEQLIPVVLFVMSLLALVWLAIDRKSASVRVFQITMLLMVLSGVAGVALHYGLNSEFELEMDPEMTGAELFWRTMHGAAPALAPGAMVQLGLIGLVYTFKHPALEH